MAACGLSRLGLAARAAELLDPEVMVPQVGQGALAVECREDDPEAREVLARIEDRRSRLAVDAERAYLSELGAGCRLPVGAWARCDDGEVVLSGFLAGADGAVLARRVARGQDPVALGR